jgi:arylsulfatase A-like enzyme
MGSLHFCARKREEKPNIIYINIDDLGWKDLGFMGSEFYETPRVDALASEGVVFTNAYAPAANCAPSRASCLTGQYTPRHGIYTVNNADRGDSRTRKLIPVTNRTVLPANQVTIAENLKANGYVTAHIGKWHLGDDSTAQGFDINIGGSSIGHPKGYFSPYQNPDLEDGPQGEYLTDRLTEEAIQFIKNNQTRPFFLHLAFYAVHSPLQPKAENLDKYLKKQGASGQNNARYAAMIESIDENIGRILEALEGLNLTKKTVIVFSSDNGGVRRTTSMAPLRAGKGSYYEGGIRVPLIIRWPGKIKSGIRFDAPVNGIDLYPTFLEMTQIPIAEGKTLDGLSLVPLLTQTGRIKERPLFWHFPIYLERGNKETRDPVFRMRPGSAVRMGDWKLHEYFEDGGLELYNLREDIGEKHNRVEEYPEKARELHQRLVSWRNAFRAPVPIQLNPEYDEEYDKKLRLKLISE